jgi:hypothetical protein
MGSERNRDILQQRLRGHWLAPDFRPRGNSTLRSLLVLPAPESQRLFADNPVIVPDRELEEDKKPGASDPPRIRCRSAVGRPARNITGCVSAVIRGTHLIRAACAPLASTSGLKRSASSVEAGRRTPTGTRSDRAD